MSNPIFNFDFSLHTENPEVAEAHGKAIALFMAQFSGQGTAAQNHRASTARAPRAVADAPDGMTDADLRAWYKAWMEANPGHEVQIDGKPIGLKGRLAKAAREELIRMRAEAEQETDDPDAMLDAEVVELEETPEPATKAPRKWTRTGRTGAPKA